jgi:hypothetical protein
MNRPLLLAAALAVGLWSLSTLVSLPAWATTPTNGTRIEIADCQYTYVLGGEAWSIECRYRIDEGEWRHITSSGNGGSWELRLPGTSVQGTVVESRIQWSFGDEVASLRVGARQVK